MSHPIDPGQDGEKSRWRRAFRPGGWAVSTLLFLGLLPFYLINDRVTTIPDTLGNTLLPLTLLRGEGVYLDRFRSVYADPDGRLPDWLGRFGPHIVPRHPVGAAIVAFPLMATGLLLMDAFDPNWDRNAWPTMVRSMAMARFAAILLTALTVVVLYQLLVRMGLGRVALASAIVTGLGSDFWVTSCQALWPHGPAALTLSLTILLLLPRPPISRTRLLLAGLSATLMVWCRPIDACLALFLALYVARADRRGLGWFLAFPIAGGLALAALNYWLFGTPVGGQAELERLHPARHGVAGPWSGSLLEGAAGTLFSPSRGLFVFCPWALLALATLPAARDRLADAPVARWMLWALLPFGLIFAKYAVWWGGHCFGPRYWIDVTPLLTIALAASLDRARERSRPLASLFALTIAWSLAIQGIGAFSYPSSWNASPANVDLAHERLWDWRDTEVSRCLAEWGKARQIAVTGDPSIRPSPTPRAGRRPAP